MSNYSVLIQQWYGWMSVVGVGLWMGGVYAETMSGWVMVGEWTWVCVNMFCKYISKIIVSTSHMMYLQTLDGKF